MNIVKNLREYCFDISTLWGLGEWKTGSLLSSLLAFPILLIGKIIYRFLPHVIYWISGIGLFFSFLIVSLAYGFLTDKDKSTIVLDRIIGMIVAFLYIPLTFKLMIVGFILFHVIKFFTTFLFYKISNRKMESLFGGVGTVLGDIVSGLLCNVILQIIRLFFV